MLNFLNILISLIFMVGLNNSDLEKYLDANLDQYSSYEYKFLSKSQFAVDKVEIDFSREFELKGSYGYVPILLVQNKVETKSTLTLKLKLKQLVFVASRKIKNGEQLKPTDFIVENREVTSVRGNIISDNTDVTKYQSKMNISEGSILVSQMINKQDDVFIGKKLNARLTHKNFSISFPAIARNSASIGEIIRVKRNDGIVFKAKVVSKNEVEIVE